MKKIFSIILLLVLSLGLFACSCNGKSCSNNASVKELDKKDVTTFVIANLQKITEIVTGSDLNKLLELEGVDKYHESASNIIVLFDSQTVNGVSSYHGFYYSKNGKQLTKWAGKDLTKTGKGYSCTLDNGKYFYTEAIKDGFFYFLEKTPTE